MPSIKKLFGADSQSETEGVWLDYGEIKVRVARAGGSNRKYDQVKERVFKPHRPKILAGLMGAEELRSLYAKVFAESVVTGWENVTEDDGVTPMPCTPGNVEKMLAEVPDFFAEVDKFASSLAPYRVGVEADSGN